MSMETIIIIIALNCNLKSSECDLVEYLMSGPIPQDIQLHDVKYFSSEKNPLKIPVAKQKEPCNSVLCKSVDNN